jgi:hypothetical protein
MSKPAFDPGQPFQAAVDSQESKPAFDPSKPFKASDDSSLAKDIWTKTSEGLTFGASPAAAGLGAGLGASVGTLQRGDIGLAEKLKSLPSTFGDAFSEARHQRQAEEDSVAQRRPGLSTGIMVGTTLATLPLTALKGVQAAAGLKSLSTAQKLLSLGEGVRESAKIGGLIGAASAAGRAESVGDAAKDIGTGALLGGGAQLGGNVLAAGGGAALKAAGNVGAKVGSALTGISEKEIKTYASRADEVKSLFKRHNGDIAAAADEVRGTIGKDLQVARQKLNSQISSALEDPKYSAVRINGKAIVDELDKAINNVGPIKAKFKEGEVAELKNIRDLVSNAMDSGSNGLDKSNPAFMDATHFVDPKTLLHLKEELQAIAKPSYNNGQAIFRGAILRPRLRRMLPLKLEDC